MWLGEVAIEIRQFCDPGSGCWAAAGRRQSTKRGLRCFRRLARPVPSESAQALTSAGLSVRTRGFRSRAFELPLQKNRAESGEDSCTLLWRLVVFCRCVWGVRCKCVFSLRMCVFVKCIQQVYYDVIRTDVRSPALFVLGKIATVHSATVHSAGL